MPAVRALVGVHGAHGLELRSRPLTLLGWQTDCVLLTISGGPHIVTAMRRPLGGTFSGSGYRSLYAGA